MTNTTSIQTQRNSVFPISIPNTLHFAGIFGDSDNDEDDEQEVVATKKSKKSKKSKVNPEIAKALQTVMESGNPLNVPLAELATYQKAAQAAGLAGGLMAVDGQIQVHMLENDLKEFKFNAVYAGNSAQMVKTRAGKGLYFRVQFKADIKGTKIEAWCLAPRNKEIQSGETCKIIVTKNTDGQFSYNIR